LVILRTVVDDESPPTGRRASERLVPAKIRDVSFPASVRGYDRRAVDAYVKSVNQVIAELEIGSSPPAAVRHALEQVGEQTSGILQRARETAEEITASARQEAEESTARAKAEAAEIVVNASTEADHERAAAEELVAKARAEADEILADSRAEAETTLARSRADAAQRLQRSQDEVAALREEAEARMRELDADTESVWEERRALLDDMGGMAARLAEATSEAADRFPPREPAEPAEEEMLEPEAGAETEPLGVAATDEPLGGDAGGRAPRGPDDEPPDEEPK
jgi:DivIVA domain-containing protein